MEDEGKETDCLLYSADSSNASYTEKKDNSVAPLPRKLFKSAKDVWILISTCIAFFASMCAFSILAPFFTFEGKKKGVSSTTTGLIFAVYPLVQVVVCPFIGKWLPLLGVKFTLFAGAFLGGGSLILFGFVEDMEAGAVFITFCFAIRITTAVGAAALDTAAITTMSITFKDHLNLVVGLMEFFTGAGLMAGPSLGGLLYQVGGFKFPFICIGSLVLLLIPILGYTLPSNTDAQEEENHNNEEEESPKIFSVLFMPGVFLDCFVTSVFALSASSLEPTLTNYLEELTNNGLSTVHVGIIWLISPLTYSIGAPIFGYWLNKKISSKAAIVIGSFGCFVSFMLLGPSPLLPTFIKPSLALVCISLGIYGFISIPMYLPILSDMQKSAEDAGVPPSLGLTGILSGLFSSAYYIGNIIGPSLAGWLRDELSFEWTITVFAFLILPEAILVLILFTWDHRKKSKTVSVTKVKKDIA